MRLVDYFVRFFAVTSNCKVIFERSKDRFGEGTADIIRLIGSCMIHKKDDS
jgi:hypothetical protein